MSDKASASSQAAVSVGAQGESGHRLRSLSGFERHLLLPHCPVWAGCLRYGWPLAITRAACAACIQRWCVRAGSSPHSSNDQCEVMPMHGRFVFRRAAQRRAALT